MPKELTDCKSRTAATGGARLRRADTNHSDGASVLASRLTLNTQLSTINQPVFAIFNILSIPVLKTSDTKERTIQAVCMRPNIASFLKAN
jgi:hypothetical protein